MSSWINHADQYVRRVLNPLRFQRGPFSGESIVLVVLERFLPTLIHLADSHRRFADLFGRRNRSVVVLHRLPGIVVILMLQFSVGVSSAVGSSLLLMNTCV